ncbi:hypothetical protein RBB50_010582 [Rhinocladiella similis]
MSKEPAVKMIAFLSRRSDFSHYQFERYYEDQHAPLALRAGPKISKYVPNYIDQDALFNNRPGGAPCDVDTEVCWDTEDDYQECQASCATSEIFKELKADEANFMDTEAIKICLVREKSSEIA